MPLPSASVACMRSVIALRLYGCCLQRLFLSWCLPGLLQETPQELKELPQQMSQCSPQQMLQCFLQQMPQWFPQQMPQRL